MKITQRKDGLYEIRVYLGTENKKPKYKSVYAKTQKEVKEKAFQVKIDARKGIKTLQESKKHLSYWIDAWKDSIESESEETWHKTLCTRADYWKDALGDEQIDKITTADLNSVLKYLANHNTRKPNAKTSNKTLIEYRSVISRVFEFCIENRVLTFNPASYIKLPKASKKAVRKPLTNAQIKYFEDTPDELQLTCLLMIYCGLRKGEALALNYSDIDLENNVIHITKSLNSRTYLIKAPKTEAGYRDVPIPQAILSYIKNAKRDTILVATRNGKPFAYSNAWNWSWNAYMKKICDKYGVEFRTTAHCLRHTYATILYEASIDELTACKLMGHADIKTTMKIYTHLREEHEARNITKLDEYLSKRA